MVDNVPITAGTGTDIATDDVSSVHYQKVKLDVGGDGASIPVVNSLPVSSDVAHDAVDSGNPVKIGGVATTTAGFVASGDRVDARFDRSGHQFVSLVSEGESIGASVLSSASGSRDVGLITHSYMLTGSGGSAEYAKEAGADATTSSGLLASGLMGYNGTTWDRVRVANTGRLQVDVIGGGIGHDSPDSGAPIKIGGYANSTAPTAVANADRVNAWFGTNGQLANMLVDSTGTILVSSSAATDGLSAASGHLGVRPLNYVYNGSTWDRSRTVGVGDAAAATGIAAAGLMGYNGTTWDRVRVANTGRLQVDVVTGGGGGVQYTEGDTDTTITGTAMMWEQGSDTLSTVSAANPLPITIESQNPSLAVGGDGVEDLALPSGTLVVGGRASTAIPTAVSADNDTVRAWYTRVGAAVIDGGIAHDAVDSGNPVKIGGKASSGNPTAVATGDRVDAFFDTFGKVGVFVQTRNGTQDIMQGGGASDGFSGVSGLATNPMALLLNGSLTWDRQRAANSDAQAATGIAAAGLMGYNGTTWDRIRSAGDNADSIATVTLGRLTVNAKNQLYNGTTWDRMRGDTTNGLDVDVTRTPLPHLQGGITPLSIAAAYTAQQTSTNLIAGTGGQRIYVTSITIATGGTTSGRVSIYWGTGAFSAGTSVTLFDGEFAPSTTSKPGAVLNFTIPRGGSSATGDNLRITTSAAMTVYVTGMAYKS